MKKLYFKYRCTSGKHIESTVPYINDLNTAIAKLIRDYRHSITPIVEIEGKPVDIRRKLRPALAAAKDEVEYWKSQVEKLEHEISQYNKIFDK